MHSRNAVLHVVLLLSFALTLSCTSKQLTRAQAEELLKKEASFADSQNKMLVYQTCRGNMPDAAQVIQILTASGVLSSKPCPYELTPMGTMKGWRLVNVMGGVELQAPCFIAVFERVNGIREDGPNKAIVDFDVSWKPPAGITEVRNQAPGLLYEGNCNRSTPTVTNFRANFGLFDDGWRIESVNPLT